MSTPEPDDNTVAQTRRDAARKRTRFSREVRLPLDVRKELLITRAALERHDCVQALHEVRGGVRRVSTFGGVLPRLAGLSKSGSWLKLLGVTRDHPMVSTALTLAVPLLRHTPIGRWAWKLGKLGAIAGAGYWTWKHVRDNTAEGAVPAATNTDADGDGQSKPVDTGFRDPLIR